MLALLIGLPLVGIFLVVRLVNPALAVLAVLLVGLALAFGGGMARPLASELTLSTLTFIAPAWDLLFFVLPSWVSEAARLGLRGFVGGHPMAGTEKQGFADNPDAVAGGKIFASLTCMNCHTYLGSGSSNFGAPDLTGRTVLTAGLGGMGGAQPLAATLAGAAILCVEVDPTRIERRLDLID